MEAGLGCYSKIVIFTIHLLYIHELPLHFAAKVKVKKEVKVGMIKSFHCLFVNDTMAKVMLFF